ncbi:hypothetical protein [Blautia wexlerae]|jgi:hypothetical protein
MNDTANDNHEFLLLIKKTAGTKAGRAKTDGEKEKNRNEKL